MMNENRWHPRDINEVLSDASQRAHEKLIEEQKIDQEAIFYHQGYLALVHVGIDDDFAFNEMARYQAREHQLEDDDFDGIRDRRLGVEQIIIRAIVDKLEIKE